MISYVNVHAILDARRARAKEATTTASADSVSLPVPKESQVLSHGILYFDI